MRQPLVILAKLITSISLVGLCAILASTAQASGNNKPANAATATGGMVWASLTGAQQGALAPLKAEWSSIEPARKAKWLEVAAKFDALPADERQRIQTRMAEWARMSPAQRAQTRLQFQQARQLSAKDRQERWAEYQALAPDQKQALNNQARPVSMPVTPAVSRPSISAALGNPKAQTSSPSATRPNLAPRPAGPTQVRTGPGATTTLITKAGSAPKSEKLVQGAGVISLPQNFDHSTLLPKHSASAPALQAVGAASAPLPHQ